MAAPSRCLVAAPSAPGSGVNGRWVENTLGTLPNRGRCPRGRTGWPGRRGAGVGGREGRTEHAHSLRAAHRHLARADRLHPIRPHLPALMRQDRRAVAGGSEDHRLALRPDDHPGQPRQSARTGGRGRRGGAAARAEQRPGQDRAHPALDPPRRPPAPPPRPAAAPAPAAPRPTPGRGRQARRRPRRRAPAPARRAASSAGAFTSRHPAPRMRSGRRGQRNRPSAAAPARRWGAAGSARGGRRRPCSAAPAGSRPAAAPAPARSRWR